MEYNIYVIVLILIFINYQVNSEQLIECFDWGTPAQVHIDCQNTRSVIRIIDVQHGITKNISTQFCQQPNPDTSSHCFDSYFENERRITATCNLETECSLETSFLSFADKCNDFNGDKYIWVKYDCVTTETDMGKEIMMVDMTRYNLNSVSPKVWEDQQMFYLLSTNYPSFTSLDINICELTIKANTVVQMKIMDLYTKNERIDLTTDCQYELITNHYLAQLKTCAHSSFQALNLVQNFTSGNQQETFQIAFKKNYFQGTPQGKMWLLIQTMNQNNEITKGLLDVNCNANIPLWTQLSSTTTDSLKSTTAAPRQTGSTNTASIPESTAQSSVEKLENSTTLPIIIGVVAGGIVILAIVIIILILIIRRRMQDKPMKQAEVIDAWDNKSVISAAQESAQEYKKQQSVPSYELEDNFPVSYINSYPSFMSQFSANGDIYSEVVSISESKTSVDAGISNKGFEEDAYYMGDVDDATYSSASKTGTWSKKKSDQAIKRENLAGTWSKKKNENTLKRDTLSGSRISDLYSQPNKPKKPAKPKPKTSSSSSFDDPSWIDDNAEFTVNQDIYGYSTQLD